MVERMRGGFSFSFLFVNEEEGRERERAKERSTSLSSFRTFCRPLSLHEVGPGRRIRSGCFSQTTTSGSLLFKGGR